MLEQFRTHSDVLAAQVQSTECSIADGEQCLKNAGHAGARCMLQRVLEVGMYVVARGREQLMSWNEGITMAYRPSSLAEVGLKGKVRNGFSSTAMLQGRLRPVNIIPWLIKPPVQCQRLLVVGLQVLSFELWMFKE